MIEQWLEALSRVRRAPGKRPAGAPVPYRGLASFQAEDADWFYGRKKLTGVLVGHLSRQYVTGGVLVVVGPSGSGKSSLLRAGLIPALRSGALGVPGSQAWPLALFTPGARPLQQLAAQLALMTGTDQSRVAGALLSRPGSCGDLARQVPGRDGNSGSADGSADGRDGSRLVVVADQFEEIFTACPDERERQAFITALCAAAGPGPGNGAGGTGEDGCEAGPAALVVLGLRADFYPHALRYPELVPALQDGQVVVGPMTEAELRSAIVEPARRARFDIEDGLVEVLLRDLAPAAGDGGAGAAPGAGTLPLLSHALLTTWERARRGRLTVADYRDSGGIQGAVARTAEQVYGELTGTQQNLARQIFIRLVHVADDTADTRRRVSRSEFLLSDANAQRVLDLFIERRLVTAETDAVEIAHEALLSAWPRLRGWIDADRGGGRIHRQLSSAAEIWRDSDRDPNVLYRGGRLAAAGDWAGDPAHQAALNRLEREFLDASTDHQIAEEHAARRRTRRLQRLAAALTVLSLAVGFLAVFAFRQKAAATHQRNLAISRQVAIDANQLRSTDIALAMQLSLAAYRIAPTPEARSSLLDSYSAPAVTRILGPPGVMQTVAFTPDGTTMAAAGENSTVRLWSLARPGRPRPLTGDTSTVFTVAFSPDGKTVASGGADKTVRLWNVTNPRKAVPWAPPLTGPASTVYSVAFSPDGTTLAAGSADGTVRLWNVTKPSHPVPLGIPLTWPHSGYVQAVAFSPDGRLLAAGSAGNPGSPGGRGGIVRLWAVTDPGHPLGVGPLLTGPAHQVFSLAFSPDSAILAAGSGDNEVRLWHVADPRHPAPDGAPLTGPASWVNSVAFSPDGRSLAAASSDSKVWIWDLASRQLTITLPHPAPVTTVLFLHDSHTVATSGADGIARIWRVPGPILGGEAGPFFSAVFSRGHVLAVDSSKNTARLWNVADPRQPAPLGPVLANVSRSGQGTGAAALSPDARTLVAGAGNGTCQVWDVRNPAHPVPSAQLRGPDKPIESIAFSPSGRILAVTSDDKTVRLWNMADPQHPAAVATLTGPTNYAYSAAFSPDGRILAAGSADKLIYLWNISNPARPVPLGRPLAGARSYVFSVAFSPDGRTLAAGSADDDIRFWNITNPARPVPLGPPLTGPTNQVYSVAFSPDGRTLAATAGDGSIWLWNMTSLRQPGLLATLTGPAGAVFTGTFGATGPILATGGSDSLVRLWNTSTSQVAAYVCATAGDHITRDEWRKYIPGLPYVPPC